MKAQKTLTAPWIKCLCSTKPKIVQSTILAPLLLSACASQPPLVAPDAPTIRQVLASRMGTSPVQAESLTTFCATKPKFERKDQEKAQIKSKAKPVKKTPKRPEFTNKNAEQKNVAANETPKRPRTIQDGVGDMNALMQAHQQRLAKHFDFLPNPILLMYIHAHRSSAGTPVPGYLTFFKLYRCDQAALKSELKKDPDTTSFKTSNSRDDRQK